MACYRLQFADPYLVLRYRAEASSAVHLLRAGELLEILRGGAAGVLIDWTSVDGVTAAQAGQILDLAGRHPDLFRVGIAFLLRPEAGDYVALRDSIAEIEGLRADVFADRGSAISWLKARSPGEGHGPSESWGSRPINSGRESRRVRGYAGAPSTQQALAVGGEAPLHE